MRAPRSPTIPLPLFSLSNTSVPEAISQAVVTVAQGPVRTSRGECPKKTARVEEEGSKKTAQEEKRFESSSI